MCVCDRYHIAVGDNAGRVLRDFIFRHSVLDFRAILKAVEVLKDNRRPRRILSKVFCILCAIGSAHVDSRRIGAVTILVVCVAPNDIHNQVELFGCMCVRDGDKVILFGNFLFVTANRFFINGVLNRSPFLEILVQTLEGFCPVVCGGKVLFNVGAIGSGQSDTQRVRTQTVLIVVVIPDLSDCLSQFLRLVGIRDLECALIGVGNISSISVNLILSDSVYDFFAFIEEFRHILKYGCKAIFIGYDMLIDFTVRALQRDDRFFCADTIAVVVIVPDGGDRHIHSSRYIVVGDGEAVPVRALNNLVSVRIAVCFL